MGISLLRPTRAGGSCCGAGGGLAPNTSEPCTALGAAQDPPPGSHRGLEAPAARGTAPNTGRTLRPLPGLRHQGTVQGGPVPPPAAPCSPRSPSPPPHCTPSCSPSPVPLALSCLLLGSALCWHQDPLPTWGPPPLRASLCHAPGAPCSPGCGGRPAPAVLPLAAQQQLPHSSLSCNFIFLIKLSVLFPQGVLGPLWGGKKSLVTQG